MQSEQSGVSRAMNDTIGEMAGRLDMTHEIALKLACQREGFTLVYCDAPSEHPDAIGARQTDPTATVQALTRNRLAIRRGTERDSYYAAAHEIAEARNGFTGHHQQCWREQCTILARWCRLLLEDAA